MRKFILCFLAFVVSFTMFCIPIFANAHTDTKILTTTPAPTIPNIVKNKNDLYLVFYDAVSNIKPSAVFTLSGGYNWDSMSADYKLWKQNLPYYNGSSINISNNTVNVKFNYRIGGNVYKKAVLDNSFELTNDKEKELYNKVNEILALCKKDGNSKYETELAIHNYIVNNSTYGSSKDNQDAYYLLIDGKGVCNAYSEAMHLLLNAAGIECIIVMGDADNGTGKVAHAWNQVKLDDGQWYELDATWNDPIYDIPVLKHNYFNITSAQMNKDHFRNDGIYNECTATKYNYYIKENILCAENDTQLYSEIDKKFKNIKYPTGDVTFTIHLLYDIENLNTVQNYVVSIAKNWKSVNISTLGNDLTIIVRY